MVQHHVSKSGDLRMQFRGDGLRAKPLKRIHQGVRKTVLPVAMLHDALPLHIVQNFAHLLRRKFVMIQKRNKAGDGPLEIDVVLPQRVVGVDQESLG